MYNDIYKKQGVIKVNGMCMYFIL